TGGYTAGEGERLMHHELCAEAVRLATLLTAHPATADPESFTRITREYMDWADRMRNEGRLKGGNRLTDDAGKIMRGNGGKPATTDGPYPESKEIIGGYFMLTAGDYAEACRIAATCPHLKYGSSIEVRQVMEL
ncbi:MAG TPA: YciI family protein, partial [Steroidobacteraceae bacterium]|nr:YciI family protein [Steroidobacteraceae bacterium]